MRVHWRRRDSMRRASSGLVDGGGHRAAMAAMSWARLAAAPGASTARQGDPLAGVGPCPSFTGDRSRGGAWALGQGVHGAGIPSATPTSRAVENRKPTLSWTASSTGGGRLHSDRGRRRRRGGRPAAQRTPARPGVGGAQRAGCEDHGTARAAAASHLVHRHLLGKGLEGGRLGDRPITDSRGGRGTGSAGQRVVQAALDEGVLHVLGHHAEVAHQLQVRRHDGEEGSGIRAQGRASSCCTCGGRNTFSHASRSRNHEARASLRTPPRRGTGARLREAERVAAHVALEDVHLLQLRRLQLRRQDGRY